MNAPIDIDTPMSRARQTLAQHQIQELHGDPTGYLIVVCLCGAHADQLDGVRIANHAEARDALAQHQAFKLQSAGVL